MPLLSLQRPGIQSLPSRTGRFSAQSVFRLQGVHNQIPTRRTPAALRTQGDFGASAAYTRVIPQPKNASLGRTLLSRDQMLSIMFDAAVNAFVTGAFKRPSDLFCTVEELGLVGSIRECNALLTALRKNKQHNAMCLFLEHMRQREIEPDEVTYALLISACAALSGLQQAESYFDQLKSSNNLQLTVHSYRAIVFACIECDNFEKARAYFDEMVGDGIQLNPAIMASLFRHLANRSSHVAEAANLCAVMLKEMEEDNTPLMEEIYKAAAQIYSKASYDSQLAALYETMKERGVEFDSSTYCSVLLGLSNKPDHKEQKYRIQNDMEKDGIRPSLSNYHRQFMSRAQSGDDRQSLMLLDEMDAANFQPILLTYNLAIRRYSEVYSKADVAEVWRRVQEILDRMKAGSVVPDIVTYRQLLSICVLNEDPRKGIEFFEDMKAQGVSPDSAIFNKMIRLSATLRQRGEEIPAGYSVDALLEEMEKEGIEFDLQVCATAVRHLRKEEDAEEKVKTFMSKINQAGLHYDKALFNITVRFWIHSGDKAMVREVLSDALKQRKISRTIIYTIVIREFVYQQQFTLAVEFLREMVNAGVAFSDVTLKVLKHFKNCDVSDDTRAEINTILGPDQPVQF